MVQEEVYLMVASLLKTLTNTKRDSQGEETTTGLLRAHRELNIIKGRSEVKKKCISNLSQYSPLMKPQIPCMELNSRERFMTCEVMDHYQ